MDHTKGDKLGGILIFEENYMFYICFYLKAVI